jgi:hypothetical protein
MKKLMFLLFAFIVANFAFLAQPLPAAAEEAAAAPADPAAVAAAVEKRLTDLEAYVNNGARAEDKSSKIMAPGPGHNGFIMVCAALVLFMTMPGLALFYGGLVRSKNVLSVMAQCMGIAGLVTLLWWAVGYSFAFSPGSPFLGNLDMALLKGVGAAPNTTYAAWVSQDTFAMFQPAHTAHDVKAGSGQDRFTGHLNRVLGQPGATGSRRPEQATAKASGQTEPTGNRRRRRPAGACRATLRGRTVRAGEATGHTGDASRLRATGQWYGADGSGATPTGLGEDGSDWHQDRWHGQPGQRES